MRRASRANDLAIDCCIGVEVFDGALAVDPCQRASGHVQNGPADQLGPSNRVEISSIEIASPERPCQTEVSRGELSIARGGADCLEQKMAQEEPQVERRVARVGTLEIQENQSARVDENVLGAEVAQNERSLVRWADPSRRSRH